MDKNREKPAIDRFLDYVVKNDTGCWGWRGPKATTGGYGVLWEEGKLTYAHRFSYRLHNGGVLARGKHILHSCDNPPCTNPQHLREGTDADNMADKVKRNRQARGETSHLSKLTETKVQKIRDLYASGVKQCKIAHQFGVDPSNISYIINKKTWK